MAGRNETTKYFGRETKSMSSQPQHLIVKALAGTGKTSSMVEGLKVMKGKASIFTPSPQQAEIWETMALSVKAKKIAAVAFNKSIATVLQQQVPAGCEAMTLHSMGFRSIKQSVGYCKVNKWRVMNVICSLYGMEFKELRQDKTKANIARITEKLVGLCKMTLISGNDTEELAGMASHYDVDTNGCSDEVFELVPQVLEACKEVEEDREIDFNDMIWLPIILNLPVFKHALLIVDESQDLNRCQQELALKAGSRLILVGDRNQAIYGFAGADAESMDNMYDRLSETTRGCQVLPLTVTRRCGRAIVQEAQKYVPEFEAHENNPDGLVRSMPFSGQKSYREDAEAGDMILCRVNAPLVSECFKFLREGRAANIQGRDIGQGLISTIKKLNAEDTTDLVEKIGTWLAKEETKERARKSPNENRLINLQDRHDCILIFAANRETVEGTIKEIEEVFTDTVKNGVLLSSVHKAKGLESDRVFILKHKDAPMPHPMATKAWQQEQEKNLIYVAITRAKNELVYVT